MNPVLRWLVVIVLVMCPATWAHDSENTVTDSLGRRVRVPVPVRRAVSLSASGVECIQIMGRMDTLVGVTEHTKTRIGQFPEIAGLPSVGRGFMPNLEVIAELRPDVVLAWKTNPGPELERQLEPLGIAVLRLDLTEPKTLPEEMRTLASILGTEAQARTEAYWEWVARWTAQIQNSIAGHPKPTVLAEHFTPLRIAGPGSGLYELTQMAGGNNLAGDIGISSMQVDSEWVLERNPQIFVKSILLGKQNPEEDSLRIDRCLHSVLERDNWRLLDAVTENRVYVLDSDIASGPRYVIGLAELASWFYPEASVPSGKRIYEEWNKVRSHHTHIGATPHGSFLTGRQGHGQDAGPRKD